MSMLIWLLGIALFIIGFQIEKIRKSRVDGIHTEIANGVFKEYIEARHLESETGESPLYYMLYEYTIGGAVFYTQMREPVRHKKYKNNTPVIIKYNPKNSTDFVAEFHDSEVNNLSAVAAGCYISGFAMMLISIIIMI